MKTSGKKKTGLIVVLVVILVILAAGTVFAWNLHTQALQEIYDQAETYFAAGNYREAYHSYLQVEDFKDASDKASQVLKLMEDSAKTHMAVAQQLSDLKFNTVAGLYLTAVLEEEQQFTLDDYNEMAKMVGSFYELATQQYAEVQTIDDKDSMTLPVMEKLMPRIEALEDSKDPQEALSVISEITTFSLADQVFFHCWTNGTFADTSLYDMAQALPVWVPAMDQVISATDDLDVVALVNKS